MEYAGLLQDVRAWLGQPENQQRVMSDWFELIRLESVSGTGEPVERCCDWIKGKMEDLGVQTTKYPIKPSPVLVGRYGSDPNKKTVLIYAHYDVKPAGERSAWRTEPFEPTVIGDKVYARGSADNKSPLMAHLKALEYYQNKGLRLPVNLIFLFEGDEEAGSKGLPEFLAEHKQELGAADVVFFSDGPKDPSGLPIIALGAKGNLHVHLTLKTMEKNVHSRYAPVLPSAAWQLVGLLGKLKQDDRVLIPGFYDDVPALGERELEIMRSLPDSEEALNADCGAPSSNYGADFYPRLLGMPTFNIGRLQSGGLGVVPALAEAVIDIRLVPGMSAQKTYRQLCDYIAALGYDNVQVKIRGVTEPSKTDVDTPYLPAIEDICRAVYGKYVIYPCRPSSAPDYLWTNILELPALQVRWSDADSDNHAPNEHLSIHEYMDGIALTVCALQAIAGV